MPKSRLAAQRLHRTAILTRINFGYHLRAKAQTVLHGLRIALFIIFCIFRFFFKLRQPRSYYLRTYYCCFIFIYLFTEYVCLGTGADGNLILIYPISLFYTRLFHSSWIWIWRRRYHCAQHAKHTTARLSLHCFLFPKRKKTVTAFEPKMRKGKEGGSKVGLRGRASWG